MKLSSFLFFTALFFAGCASSAQLAASEFDLIEPVSLADALASYEAKYGACPNPPDVVLENYRGDAEKFGPALHVSTMMYRNCMQPERGTLAESLLVVLLKIEDGIAIEADPDTISTAKLPFITLVGLDNVREELSAMPASERADMVETIRKAYERPK